MSHITQVLWRLLDWLKARVVCLHECIDLFSIVLFSEASDMALFLVNFALHLVLLDVKVCRVFIFDQMVLLEGEHCVVGW